MQTILILDDDIRLNQHWQTLLEREGYLVIGHFDTDRAIQSLDQSKIDLVISDMIIRDAKNDIQAKGGLSLLAYIAMELPPPIPKIIAITGSPPELHLDKHAESMHTDICLRKPIGDGELVKAVKSLLENNGSEKDLEPPTSETKENDS